MKAVNLSRRLITGPAMKCLWQSSTYREHLFQFAPVSMRCFALFVGLGIFCNMTPLREPSSLTNSTSPATLQTPINLDKSSKFTAKSSTPHLGIVCWADKPTVPPIQKARCAVQAREAGYSLWWPIRADSTRTGDIFHTSGIWKRRDFTCRSIWKSREICHLGI